MAELFADISQIYLDQEETLFPSCMYAEPVVRTGIPAKKMTVRAMRQKKSKELKAWRTHVKQYEKWMKEVRPVTEFYIPETVLEEPLLYDTDYYQQCFEERARLIKDWSRLKFTDQYKETKKVQFITSMIKVHQCALETWREYHPDLYKKMIQYDPDCVLNNGL